MTIQSTDSTMAPMTPQPMMIMAPRYKSVRYTCAVAGRGRRERGNQRSMGSGSRGPELPMSRPPGGHARLAKRAARTCRLLPISCPTMSLMELLATSTLSPAATARSTSACGSGKQRFM